ncbi:MAG: transposase family protein [Chthoniobacterales bacterium]|nr:transposase family protein [Chthoniobacterales bacterium]
MWRGGGDIKKLDRIVRPSHRVTHDRRDQVRGAGWEFVHVCIDDASRLAFAQIMPDETQHSAVLFLERALAYFASLGIKAQRLMSDNGSCYRSHLFRAAPRRHGLRHLFTRPYAPRTNGKAERFIQTSQTERGRPLRLTQSSPTGLPAQNHTVEEDYGRILRRVRMNCQV